MKRTGVVTDPLYIRHDPGAWHPESPERLRAIYARLEETGLMEQLQAVAPRPATEGELARVHDPDYIRRVLATEGRGASFDPDTSTSPDSVAAALLAAGGSLALLERIAAGELDNGFALVRPPGHHAERARAMGFCLFNNVAICAEHARQVLGLSRVMIVDWDLHHGNGSMHSFYDRPDVYYLSTHQYPHYPGTGALEDVGTRAGEGATLNVPLPGGMGDVEYQAIFRELVAPAVAAFAPDLILVSAGFDTYGGDPLGGMHLTAAGFGALAAWLVKLAAGSAGGRLLLLLEGGYHIRGQAESVEAVLRALHEAPEPPAHKGAGQAERVITAVRRVHARFIPAFAAKS